MHPEGENLWYFKHYVFDLTDLTENVERHVRLSYRGVTKILWGGEGGNETWEKNHIRFTLSN